MRKIVFFALMISVSSPALIESQQAYRLPDIRSMKHLTTRPSEHCAQIPGKETTQDFYSGPDGLVVTVYSFRGRNVAFSTHNNSDPQKTYRVFMDIYGDGMFREIDRSQHWELPPWSRM
ncbi:MAG: hypothetical protein AB1646_20945 [Thermodesulfobacteriota bacterium]